MINKQCTGLSLGWNNISSNGVANQSTPYIAFLFQLYNTIRILSFCMIK
jgi:hypothetical protein